tara:strand:- start:7076 stop:7447 length:372 start_codon:yes stop_codon:yes gene_type:complete
MSEENKQPELPEIQLDENENPDLVKEVELDNELKQWFIDYVGRKSEPEDGVVTVGMVVQIFAQEFPEFLAVVAEENWIRGYRQGIADSEEGVRQAFEQAGVDPRDVFPSQESASVQEPPSEEE